MTTLVLNFRERIAGLYYGWRMIGIVSALRILGGGLHQYGFTVFFLPVTNELGLSRAATSLAFSLARAQGSFASALVGYLEWDSHLAVINSQANASVDASAPMPKWGWGEVKGPYTPDGGNS